MSDKQPLRRMAPGEFRHVIETALVIMRQRSEVGGLTKILPDMLAYRLTERLLQSNIIPMRGPPLEMATAHDYPGHPHHRQQPTTDDETAAAFDPVRHAYDVSAMVNAANREGPTKFKQDPAALDAGKHKSDEGRE
jgi:hypothetical protein